MTQVRQGAGPDSGGGRSRGLVRCHHRKDADSVSFVRRDARMKPASEMKGQFHDELVGRVQRLIGAELLLGGRPRRVRTHLARCCQV
jgi:hypothetical protein